MNKINNYNQIFYNVKITYILFKELSVKVFSESNVLFFNFSLSINIFVFNY